MGDAYIVRRGGGSGLSKCSIIVHVETDSTVAAYSNPAATTKVKDAKEIGTSGSYVITGLNTGTYYVKAEKGTKSKTSSAVSFSADAVKEVTLNYSLDLIVDGVVQSGISFVSHSATATYDSSDKTLKIKADGSLWVGQEAYYSVNVDVTNYTSLKVKCRNSGDTNSVHARIVGGSTYDATTISQAISTTLNTHTINISGLSNSIYISINASSYLFNQDTGEKYVAVAAIEDMWLE